MSNHTPTPWFVGKKGRTGHRVFATQQGTDGVVAAGIENRANADFIVRAANSHDELLGFIRNLRDLSDAGYGDEVLAEVRGDFCGELLAKAEGTA